MGTEGRVGLLYDSDGFEVREKEASRKCDHVRSYLQEAVPKQSSIEPVQSWQRSNKAEH